MEPWACAFTGTGAGIAYMSLSRLAAKLKIDDPLDAFAVHFGGGFWGLISVTIIAHDGIVYGIAQSGHDSTLIRQAFAVRSAHNTPV
ncbi:Protein AMT-4 [Aphelenchoides avenae]|nr:Protein AMT-4 [Aphelenchus avenae]